MASSMALPSLALNTVKTRYSVPSHPARITPSGARVAPETRLQVGKLYLMILEATDDASPFGAAPTVIGPDRATCAQKRSEMARATTVVDFSTWFPLFGCGRV